MTRHFTRVAREIATNKSLWLAVLHNIGEMVILKNVRGEGENDMRKLLPLPDRLADILEAFKRQGKLNPNLNAPSIAAMLLMPFLSE